MGYEMSLNPTTNAETFEETWYLLDEQGNRIDLTDAIIEFNVQDPMSRSSVLRASSEDGNIVITSNDFTVRFEVESMRGLTPKNYFVGCTIDLYGNVKGPFTGTLHVEDGRMQ